MCTQTVSQNIPRKCWTRKYGRKYYSAYLGSVTSVLSGWHLNHCFEVNGVLHKPMEKCLKKIMHVHCIRYTKKLVLKLLEHQCSH